MGGGGGGGGEGLGRRAGGGGGGWRKEGVNIMNSCFSWSRALTVRDEYIATWITLTLNAQ